MKFSPPACWGLAVLLLGGASSEAQLSVPLAPLAYHELAPGASQPTGCTVMLKVMQQHYQATHNSRVIPFLTKYFRYQLANLPATPLDQWSEWSAVRGGDNLLVVYWLYRQTNAPFLRDLGELLYQQTTPWTTYLGNRDWVMAAAANQTGAHWMDRHGVNVAMGLKLPVVYAQAHPEQPQLPQALRTGWHDIMTLHGLPAGMFSADEDLHGNLPTQGTELCAVVETMYSLEQAAALTGDLTYLDALERIAYNALPTQTTPGPDLAAPRPPHAAPALPVIP